MITKSWFYSNNKLQFHYNQNLNESFYIMGYQQNIFIKLVQLSNFKFHFNLRKKYWYYAIRLLYNYTIFVKIFHANKLLIFQIKLNQILIKNNHYKQYKNHLHFILVISKSNCTSFCTNMYHFWSISIDFSLDLARLPSFLFRLIPSDYCLHSNILQKLKFQQLLFLESIEIYNMYYFKFLDS